MLSTAGAQTTGSTQLNDVIKRSAALLPAQGPITAFVFLNTLQALEDLPFDEGLAKGALLFGCEPYLSKHRYREKLARGRIRPADLLAALRESLGEQADVPIGSLATRVEMRLAMLQFPLRTGPAEELRWFVAETRAHTRLRQDVPSDVRERFLEQTRHWVMRDFRRASEPGKGLPLSTREYRVHQLLADLVEHFGESSLERWSERTWESLSVQALWRVCRSGVHGVETPPLPLPAPVRHRDVLFDATGDDSDALVHDILIRFCATFVDQGFADWTLPDRDQGFFKSFCALYRQSAGPPNVWLRGLPQEIARLEAAGLSPLESVQESLDLLGVPEEEWSVFIPSTLLALRGWAGMIWQMEVRGDRVALPALPGSLVEFLAVRLMLERLALAHIAREKLRYLGSLAGLRHAALAGTSHEEGPSLEARAFLIFQLAQLLGWSPGALFQLTRDEWTALVTEVETFSSLERRRVFHKAFEGRFRAQALDALAIHARRPVGPTPVPRFQAVFCIDTREESFRRHIEEVAPDTETFATAGFFSVAMYYRGVSDAHFATLCPIVIRPQHWVVEDVVYTLEDANRRRAKARRAIGTASHQVHVGSRNIASGALLTIGLGILASVPLVARVLFPRLTARIRRTFSRLVAPPPVTRLRLERVSKTPGPDEDQIGFSVEEMAQIAERVLREIGLTSGFSRLVLFLGHGAFCLNNPHKSVYDCGACSGSAGGPNARALAVMLNDPRVRDILFRHGLIIPRETFFMGGLHNTSNDSIAFLDLDLLPNSHLRDFEAALKTLDEACERNAHERCRRFESAPLDLTFEAAHRHVEERAEDLAQTRPEYGNASNAICVVGRRQRTRGLYLDRRSFLVSYDPLQDDDAHTILARILGAVVPVCEGINLQYFFSAIDSSGWGCGSKLPHNIASLLGVMDGAASDLRPGLPWQGVEIHEPIRLLFVIETTAEAILQIMERNPLIGRILRNGWVQLALLDPQSAAIQIYRDHEFHAYVPEISELPTAASSTDWYRGWRDHLGFAQIGR